MPRRALLILVACVACAAAAGAAGAHRLPNAPRCPILPVSHPFNQRVDRLPVATNSASDPALPPMGLRVRLKGSTSLAGLGPQARIVARALQRYGALLADNGSPWFFSGAPDSRWDNDDLRTLRRLQGSDFEIVDTRTLPRPR